MHESETKCSLTEHVVEQQRSETSDEHAQHEQDTETDTIQNNNIIELSASHSEVIDSVQKLPLISPKPTSEPSLKLST